MVRRVALVALALLVGGMVWAAEKQVTGTVKSIATGGGTFVVTDGAAKDWTFAVDKETLVVAKGGHHKLEALKAGGKPTTIDQFVAPKDKVAVKYGEKDGNLIAKVVDVKK